MIIPEAEQEGKLSQLTDQIVGRLNETFQKRMASPQYEYSGPEVVPVVGSRDTTALMLDRSGKWSLDFDMTSFEIPVTSVEDIIRAYASIVDPEYKRLFEIGWSQRPPSLDEITQYIQNNRSELLRGLIGGIEDVLQSLG